jgi:hypothetical protein
MLIYHHHEILALVPILHEYNHVYEFRDKSGMSILCNIITQQMTEMCFHMSSIYTISDIGAKSIVMNTRQ